jgi:hypothetical protein
MKVKVDLKDLTKIRISKHRNNKNKGIVFIDASGAEIKGHPIRHLVQASQKQQSRFDTKVQAFTLLNEEEQKELFNNPVKPQIKSNTDKSALVQAYFNTLFEKYSKLTMQELESMNTTTVLANLNDVEKTALERAIDVVKEEQEIKQLETN